MQKFMKFVLTVALFQIMNIPSKADEGFWDHLAQLHRILQLESVTSENFSKEFCKSTTTRKSIGVYSYGFFCRNDTLAAMAEIVCASHDINRYKNTSCSKYARKTLEGLNPSDVLSKQIQNGTEDALRFMCDPTIVNKLPASLQQISHENCPRQ